MIICTWKGFKRFLAPTAKEAKRDIWNLHECNSPKIMKCKLIWVCMLQDLVNISFVRSPIPIIFPNTIPLEMGLTLDFLWRNLFFHFNWIPDMKIALNSITCFVWSKNYEVRHVHTGLSSAFWWYQKRGGRGRGMVWEHYNMVTSEQTDTYLNILMW